jgi:structure-specific endonuclease subunit SLX1
MTHDDMSSESNSYKTDQTTSVFSASQSPSRTFRFHGCYMLMSLKKPERSYIGFTVNPIRRLRQHNGDLPRGGAYRTSRNRPWTMVVIVHGFVANSQALQFEWAWQNPEKTKALRIHAGRPSALPPPKKARYPTPAQRISALAALLSVPPWSHCPLTVTVPGDCDIWLKVKATTQFPDWIRIDFRSTASLGDLCDYDYGSVELLKQCSLTGPCGICTENTGTVRRATLCVACGQTLHVHCLARGAAAQCREVSMMDILLPDYVDCPTCGRHIRWDEVVRFARVVQRGRKAECSSSGAKAIVTANSGPAD